MDVFRIEVISATELDAGLEAAWRGLQAADHDLRSPFFSPEFCRIVAGVRDDVRVAVISDDAGLAGFFPVHLQRFGRLAPLAGEISDYHGIIGTRAAAVPPRALLAAFKAQAFDFNHVPAVQTGFCAQAYLHTDSPLVDLSDGYEAWRLARREVVKSMRTLDRKGRKLAREVGPLRFVANEPDPRVWQKLLEWKRASLAAIGVKFILDRPWAAGVIDAVRHSDTPAFGGLTSALWAGDELVAASFSMRTDSTGHSWFPTYNHTHARSSPGLLLLQEVLRAAADRGLTEYDLGRGDEKYKTEFANAARDICEGSLERPMTPLGLPRRLRKAAQAVADRAQKPELRDTVRRAGNRLLSAGRLG